MDGKGLGIFRKLTLGRFNAVLAVKKEANPLETTGIGLKDNQSGWIPPNAFNRLRDRSESILRFVHSRNGGFGSQNGLFLESASQF